MYEPSALLLRCNVVCKKLLVSHLSESHAEYGSKYYLNIDHITSVNHKWNSLLMRFMVWTAVESVIRDGIHHKGDINFDCELDLQAIVWRGVGHRRLQLLNMGKSSQSVSQVAQSVEKCYVKWPEKVEVLVTNLDDNSTKHFGQRAVSVDNDKQRMR